MSTLYALHTYYTYTPYTSYTMYISHMNTIHVPTEACNTFHTHIDHTCICPTYTTQTHIYTHMTQICTFSPSTTHPLSACHIYFIHTHAYTYSISSINSLPLKAECPWSVHGVSFKIQPRAVCLCPASTIKTHALSLALTICV